LHGRRIIRQRFTRLGPESIYNLTGLARTFPLEEGDTAQVATQIHFYAKVDGQAEELAVLQMGGQPGTHGAVVTTRVTAGITGIMLGLLRPGDRVLSIVPAPRSHPSVRNGVLLARAEFAEVMGIAAAREFLRHQAVGLVAITAITPTKHCFAESELRAAIALAKEHGALVFIDDAHMSTRLLFYKQRRTFELGPVDVAILSTDKHILGPRAGVIVARSELVEPIRAAVFTYGLEAQPGHYLAVVRGLENYPDDQSQIRAAMAMAGPLYEAACQRYGQNRVYQAGPGIALGPDDVLALALERSGKKESALVPLEACNVLAMAMAEEYGLITIPVVGMPGSAPNCRIMLFPDAPRAGIDKILAGMEHGFAVLQSVLTDPKRAAAIIFGQ
jgi:L-seryl-tRNA(Ser) seleniumtransferase